MCLCSLSSLRSSPGSETLHCFFDSWRGEICTGPLFFTEEPQPQGLALTCRWPGGGRLSGPKVRWCGGPVRTATPIAPQVFLAESDFRALGNPEIYQKTIGGCWGDAEITVILASSKGYGSTFLSTCGFQMKKNRFGQCSIFLQASLLIM